MKAYFTASIVGKKHLLDKYLKIISHLQNRHCEVIADHILQVTEDKIRMETKEERLQFHQQLENWIASADFLIAETTFPSISVGYEISLALHRGKPVLVLYNQGDPPSLLGHHADEKLICEKYSDDTLGDIINEFLNYIKGASDTRFTFFITPTISGYLEKISKKEKLPKSVYLRKLIEADMHNHRL